MTFRRKSGTHDGFANRVEAIHVLKPGLLARPIQRCVEVDGRQQPNALTEPGIVCSLSSGRAVAYRDLAAFLGDYFRIGGNRVP